MPVVMRISVSGIEGVQDALGKVDPQRNVAWVSRSLVACGLLTQKIAAETKIKRGGKAPPLPNILTSRTGTLRRSIGVNRYGLPFSIDVGTSLGYGAVHEGGWSGTQNVPAHTRTVAFGRKVAPFRVRAFSRRISYPARPYLAPALDEASDRFDDIFINELAKDLP